MGSKPKGIERRKHQRIESQTKIRYKIFLNRCEEKGTMATTGTVFSRIKKIVKKDRRFNEDAYFFVLSALDTALSNLSSPRHITGRELLEAIRVYGLQQYGPMTSTVLEHWGIKTTEDFGKIVFNMIDVGMLRKTDTDCLQDFKDVYDFKEVFKGNYN